ncbi:hypothetical protein GYB22_04335 [bacterium]|nr:hypothetical protein [bacterium]
MKIENNDFAKGYDPLDDMINSLEAKCEMPMEDYLDEYNKYLHLREIQEWQDFFEEPRTAYCFIADLKDNLNESSCLKFKIWLAAYFLNLIVDENEAKTVYPWDDKMTKLIMDKALLLCSMEHKSRRYGGGYDRETYNRISNELSKLAEETFHIEYYLSYIERDFERYDEE